MGIYLMMGYFALRYVVVLDLVNTYVGYHKCALKLLPDLSSTVM